MRNSLLLILLVMLSGCAKEPVVEFQKVYVPIRIYIDKPDRPKYTTNKTEIEYLLEVLHFSKELEFIIDTNNQEVKLNEKD